jgi:HEAT repeat protein
MSAKRSFEDQLAALDALRQQAPAAAVAPLRKALGHRNNYVVAKAADLVREFALAELIPELLAAFDRFFADPVKTDPQCWAKNALSRALAALEYQDAAVFLRGMHHIQLEPVWGGRSDTAGTLRGTCALALVQCRGLPETELLNHLLELFSDKDKSVRVEAVRAVEQTGSPAAALLLRLRAILGADEPEVLGACYGGILRIEGKSAIPWITRFLAAGDDPAAEAALAIASDRSPESFRALHQRFADDPPSDPWFRSVLLSAIALTRQPEAIEFLLGLVRTESLHAEAAIEAILQSGASPEIVRRLEETVSGNPRLARFMAAHAKPSS